MTTQSKSTEGHRPGNKTSEFLLNVLGAVLIAANSIFGLGIPVEGVMSIAGMIVAYTTGRSIIKKA